MLDETRVTGPDAFAGESADDAVLPEQGEDAGTQAADTPEAGDLGEGEPQDPVEVYRRKAEEWESRFKGLQARVQKEIEARRALELEKARLEAQLQQYLIAQQLEQLPEEERQVAAQQIMADMALQQRMAQLAYAEQQLQELAKHLVVMTLSQRYGVPAERLYQINDPYAMEMVAKELSQLRRQAAKSQRRSQGADRFERPQGSAGPREPETFEEAVEAIIRSFGRR